MPEIKLTDRDYRWIIAILVLAFVFVFALLFGGKSNEVVNYVGFASTMISIILSVLAIIWSFFTSGGAAAQTEKLIEASKQLDVAMNGLRDSREQIAVAIDSFQTAGQRMDHVDKTITSLADSLGKAQEAPPSSATLTDAQREERAVRSTSTLGLIALLLVTHQEQRPRRKPLSAILKPVSSALAFPVDKEYMWGFLIGFVSTGLIYSVKVEPVFSTKIRKPERLKELVDAEYERRLNKANEKIGSAMRRAYEAIVDEYNYDPDDDEANQDSSSSDESGQTSE